MLKVCVITAIINMEEQKSRGTVHIKNYMLQECAKIVILINIIKLINY
jgi:hypothetical protein